MDTLSRRWWMEWNTAAWGLHVRRLDRQEYESAGVLGRTCAQGGFSTPDCVIDFVEVMGALRSAAAGRGVEFRDGHSARTLELRNGRVTGVVLDAGESLACDACVVALGAWTVPFLATCGLMAPLAVKRCLVLRFERELVPCLTVCMDIRDGVRSRDAALAPSRGETIGAESEGDSVVQPSDEAVDRSRVDRLVGDYAACFPSIRRWTLTAAEYCFKAEHRGESGTTLSPWVYDASTEPGWPDRLVVAIPGKASLGFAMGSAAAEAVGRCLS